MAATLFHCTPTTCAFSLHTHRRCHLSPARPRPRFAPLHLSFGGQFRILASTSDFSDPSRLDGQNPPFELPDSYRDDSLKDNLESLVQFNESVPSDQIPVEAVEGGRGDIQLGGNGSGGDGGEGKSGNGGQGEGEPGDKKKKMSTSQKLTLAYATLVGVGGVIGYAKSKSTKSLIAGGGSSLVLYYVSTQLPANPVFASAVGLGVSLLLLAVMGIRFKKSGKFFPAGVVSLVSLIMTGGYIHGIMRASHA